MSQRKQKESDIVETAATIAVGAAAAYGCYKLYQTISESNPPPTSSQQVTVEQSSMNSSRRNDSPPSQSFGARVSNAIGGMQLANSGRKLCETMMDAMPQRAQSTQPLQSIHSTSYPHPVQSERPSSSTLNEGSNRNVAGPKLKGDDLLETMQAAYTGYKLCQSVFGNSDSANSSAVSCNHRQPTIGVAVVETDQQSQDALQKIKEHCQGYKVLGFECGWVHRGNTRLPISLIQLATQQGYYALFRLNKLGRFPPGLQEILCDPNIIKVSSVPQKDAQHLHEDYGILVKSVLDLRYMAREAGYTDPGGLAAMSKQCVGISLEESWFIQASDWNASYLMADQIEFAKEKTRADIELFKFFAEKIAPKRRFDSQTQHLKFIIENHCSQYLNRIYPVIC